MRWIFLIFIVVPILEMLVLIEVGSVLGSVPTVALVFLTAIIGVTMLRHQGLSTLFSFNQKINSGEIPAEELLSAVMLLLAGAFLLTPGFVTDSVGFLLLMPPFRKAFAAYLIEQGMLKAVGGFQQSEFSSFFEERSEVQGSVYEARRRASSGDVEAAGAEKAASQEPALLPDSKNMEEDSSQGEVNEPAPEKESPKEDPQNP
jgi:UPF0716 protein FxsA